MCMPIENKCNDMEVQAEDGSCHYYEEFAESEIRNAANESFNSVQRWMDTRRQIKDVRREMAEGNLRDDF